MEDTDFMAAAIELAREAATLGEVPVGAVVVTPVQSTDSTERPSDSITRPSSSIKSSVVLRSTFGIGCADHPLARRRRAGIRFTNRSKNGLKSS